ncbi:MAG: GNAT family N-acetyltransferase [Flavobacteriaceae bacterium]
MNVKIFRWEELQRDELYEILSLRSEIFVVEQDCVYQDIDFKDQKAFHICGYKEGKLVAYTRVFGPAAYFDTPSIGRVLVRENQRKYGFGHQIIEASIALINKEYGAVNIEISAQTYLLNFYESHGFKTIGEEYLEDGIPHMRMIKTT